MILNFQLVLASLQAIFTVYFAPELTEVWQACRSHPNNEMLVFHVKPLDIFPGLGVVEVGRDFRVFNIFK